MKTTKIHASCVCGRRYYKTRSDMVVCPVCQREAAERLAQASRRMHSYDAALSDFVKRLQKALEPFLGRPETAPIISALLGEFGAEKRKDGAA